MSTSLKKWSLWIFCALYPYAAESKKSFSCRDLLQNAPIMPKDGALNLVQQWGALLCSAERALHQRIKEAGSINDTDHKTLEQIKKWLPIVLTSLEIAFQDPVYEEFASDKQLIDNQENLNIVHKSITCKDVLLGQITMMQNGKAGSLLYLLTMLCTIEATLQKNALQHRSEMTDDPRQYKNIAAMLLQVQKVIAPLTLILSRAIAGKDVWPRDPDL